MSKRKASASLGREPKRLNSSPDFVYNQSASAQKVKKVSTTRIVKRPIYRFCIHYEGKYFRI
jgi:hypothetical protein